jgi:nitrate reductase NapD
MSEELHVAGIVVHVYLARLEHVAGALTRLSGAQLHAVAPDGRLVVTLESSSARAVAVCIDAIQRLEGVLSCALVYQHSESLEAMMEEISVEDHAPRVR